MTQASKGDKINLSSIKKKLLERKHELEVQLAELQLHKESADTIKDTGDQVQSSTLETLRISLQDAELNEYNLIVQALKKIDEGSFGLCVDCEQPISEKRLLSYPNASRCVACQEIREERGADFVE